MATYVPPKKNTAYIFYVGLVDQSNTKLLKANPTLASGDAKVSIDGGSFANLATLPDANPASGRAIRIQLSTSEMNGDNIVVQLVDAAGAEWCDLLVNLQTTAQQIDDLELQSTGTAIKTKTDFLPSATAGAAGGVFIAGTNAATTVTTALTTTFTGNLTGSIGSLASQAKTDVNAEALDVLNVDTYQEPGQGAPAATTTLAAKINYLYKAWRNKKTQTATTYSLYADDTTTVDQKATLSDDGTTYSSGEKATGP